MTVNEFLSYSTEKEIQYFEIWDCVKEERAYDGTISDCPIDCLVAKVESIDLINENSPYLVFNVELY
jgi:hypothetical protein